jgi:hypothetical protein
MLNLFAHSTVSDSSLEDAQKIELPGVYSLTNFPQYFKMKPDNAGKLNCAMCGNLRSCLKKRTDSDGVTPFIPATKSKGVCTSCEAAVWKVVGSNVQIKFCQQCNHFRPLALFTSKGTLKQECFVGSCMPCRNRISCLKKKGNGLAEGVVPSQARAGAVVALNEEPESQNAESPTVATKRKRSSGLQAATEIDDIVVSTLNRCVPLSLPLSESLG